MTEQQDDKYIKCTACWCKYINDDEHIKNDFGYNRIEERYRTCIKCRERRNAKALKVYLYENVSKKNFIIKYQMNKQQEKYQFRYTKCGRDEGYLKAIEKLKEIENQYDDVIIINRVDSENETARMTAEEIEQIETQYKEQQKEVMRARRTQYYQNNKDRILESKTQYRQNNKDKITEYQRQYNLNNKEKIQERREQNRDKINERAMEKMERLRMGVAESNGTKNACRRCLKLMDINNFITCNGKMYNTCKVCAPKINDKVWWDVDDEIKS